MIRKRHITHQEFKRAVKELLFKRPNKSAVPDDYEPTKEELEQVYRVESEQD